MLLACQRRLKIHAPLTLAAFQRSAANLFVLGLTPVCGHDEGYPRAFSRICFRVRRFSATADLTFGIASGPSSRSEADVGWRSHLLVSVVPLAAGSSR